LADVSSAAKINRTKNNPMVSIFLIDLLGYKKEKGVPKGTPKKNPNANTRLNVASLGA
jgi:hypothetical protein